MIFPFITYAKLRKVPAAKKGGETPQPNCYVPAMCTHGVLKYSSVIPIWTRPLIGAQKL